MSKVHVSITVVTSIVATGLVLNFANEGYLGSFAQKFANYVSKGYGSA